MSSPPGTTQNLQFEDCSVELNTYSGANGAVSDVVMRFSNLTPVRGVGLVVDDSADNGTRVRVDREGLYYVEMTMTKVAGATTLVAAIGLNASGTAAPTVAAAGIEDFTSITGVAAEVPQIKLGAYVRVTPNDIAAPGDVFIQPIACDAAGATAAALITTTSARMRVTRIGSLAATAV